MMLHVEGTPLLRVALEPVDAYGASLTVNDESVMRVYERDGLVHFDARVVTDIPVAQEDGVLSVTGAHVPGRVLRVNGYTDDEYAKQAVRIVHDIKHGALADVSGDYNAAYSVVLYTLKRGMTG